MIAAALHSETADALGYSFTGFALWIKSFSVVPLFGFGMVEIDWAFDAFMSIGGGVFLLFKGITALQQAIINRQTIKKNRREEKQAKKDERETK